MNGADVGKSRIIADRKPLVRHAFLMLIAAIACAFALSFVSSAGSAAVADDVLLAPQIAWADEQASDAPSDEAADPDAATEEEEIEDEEVPLAMAVSVGKKLQYIIIGGLAIGVVLFLLLNHHMNRNMNRMRSTFR